MLTQNHLNLRLIRLKGPEEWTNNQDGLCFVFAKGGGGKCLCRSFTERLAPGDVLVLDSAVGGKLCSPDPGEMVFACFSVCFEHLLPLFASNEICLLQGVTDDYKRARLYPASSPLASECHRLLGQVPPQYNLGHRSQLLRVAAAILTVEFDNARSRRVGFARAENHVVQVFESLSSAELLNSPVEELAGKFSCSRRHLSRLFNQHFGLSIATLRMEMRLLKAVSLLRNPDAKVAQVADECGFNHLGLFGTCFKRRFGCSPSQWRSKLAEDGQRPPGRLVADGLKCVLQINGLCPWSGPTPKPADAEALQSPKARGEKVDRVTGLAQKSPNSGDQRTVIFSADAGS